MKGHYCIPEDVYLSQECIDFLDICLQIDFRLRAGMKDLSEHAFMISGRRLTIVQRNGSHKMNAYLPRTSLQHECKMIIEAVNQRIERRLPLMSPITEEDSTTDSCEFAPVSEFKVYPADLN